MKPRTGPALGKRHSHQRRMSKSCSLYNLPPEIILSYFCSSHEISKGVSISSSLYRNIGESKEKEINFLVPWFPFEPSLENQYLEVFS